MKRSIQNLFIALVGLALPALVEAQFTFTINNGAITITGYTCGWQKIRHNRIGVIRVSAVG